MNFPGIGENKTMVERLTSDRKRRRFIVYDLEWRRETCELTLVGVLDRKRGYRHYLSVDAFLDAEIRPHNSGAWFGAHAGGLADILFLFHKFVARGWKCSGITSGSSLIIFVVERGKHRYTFVDTYWILRDRLAKIAKSVGLEKGSADFDGSLADLIPYNEMDCEILLTALERFESEIWDLGGELSMTIASTAMNLFRRVYLSEDWNVTRVVSQSLRSGYHGGRVEVYEYGRKENGNMYDINSSFSYSMIQPMPGSFMRTGRTIRPCSWVNATVRSSGNIPPLPFKADALYFPVGEWRGWFYVDELDQPGVEILQVHKVYEFQASHDLAGYVNDIYGRRKATDDPFRKLVYKYLLNSLYGKFGEREEKEKLIVNPSPEWFDTRKAAAKAARERGDEWTQAEMLIPGVFVDREELPVAHEHVALCAAITAVARVTIRKFMAQASSVHYCDTDGFSTFDEFPVSDALGALKLVKNYGVAEFFAPKIYRYDDDVRTKGFPLRAIAEELERNGELLAEYKVIDGELSPEVRLELYGKITAGETMHFRRMRRVGEQLNKRQTPVPVIETAKKQFHGRKGKRRILDGGMTEPWPVDSLSPNLSNKMDDELND